MSLCGTFLFWKLRRLIDSSAPELLLLLCTIMDRYLIHFTTAFYGSTDSAGRPCNESLMRCSQRRRFHHLESITRMVSTGVAYSKAFSFRNLTEAKIFVEQIVDVGGNCESISCEER